MLRQTATALTLTLTALALPALAQDDAPDGDAPATETPEEAPLPSDTPPEVDETAPSDALPEPETDTASDAAPTGGVGEVTEVGSVEGTFIDEEMSFVVVAYSAEGAGGSRWQDIPEGRSVALVATPAGMSQPEMTVEFRLSDDDAVSAGAVTYTDGDIILIAGAESSQITLETVETDGDMLTVAGTITAELAEDPSTGIVISEDETQTFDGRFEATLSRAE